MAIMSMFLNLALLTFASAIQTDHASRMKVVQSPQSPRSAAGNIELQDKPDMNNIKKVQGQIEQVKGTLVDNIDKLLERDEKLDVLLVKAEDLNDSAEQFGY